MDVLIKDLGLLINAMLVATPPLMFAALGSCFSERSGVINIGIEGMMTIGAFTGAVVAYFTGNGWVGFLCGGLAGAREKGKVRSEGKEYVVKDGDVVLFRFNV